MNEIKQAGVMLIIKDGLILGISRKEDSSLFGLIGGKCEFNETPMEAAIRETFEESSVIVKSCVEIYKRTEPRLKPDGIYFHSTCFFATDWEGEPKDSEEGKVVWMYAHELINPKYVPFGKGAFADYNKNTLEAFKKMFPNINLLSYNDYR